MPVVAQELLYGLTQQPDDGNDIDQYEVDQSQERTWGVSREADKWSLYEMFYPNIMSMLCKVLAVSGEATYKETLETVIQSTNDEKIRNYAKKSFEKLMCVNKAWIIDYEAFWVVS